MRMKRALKIAWATTVTIVAAVVLFFAMTTSARAPHGGNSYLGGRTIASLQEEDFDRILLREKICYGVTVNAEKATLDRRRVCKALVVNRLEAALSRPGTYLKEPLEFQCEDTVFGKPRAPASEEALAVVMKPNQEFFAIDNALAAGIDVANVAESTHRRARAACEFLTDCRWATKPDHFSLRKIASCFLTENPTHRKVLLDVVSGMLFHVKSNDSKILYADLLDSPRL
jgi:hypothetical protein